MQGTAIHQIDREPLIRYLDGKGCWFRLKHQRFHSPHNPFTSGGRSPFGIRNTCAYDPSACRKLYHASPCFSRRCHLQK